MTIAALIALLVRLFTLLAALEAPAPSYPTIAPPPVEAPPPALSDNPCDISTPANDDPADALDVGVLEYDVPFWLEFDNRMATDETPFIDSVICF